MGYFIQSEEGELIEFYLSDELLSRKEEIFGRALKEFQIKMLSASHLMIPQAGVCNDDYFTS